MKAVELRSQTGAQLAELVTAKRAEIAQLRLERRTKEVKQTHRFGQLRTEVALITTIQREQQLASEGDQS
ncbi:50S ribosomal protein L29 [Candidatus Microgenomates bacterium]|nr:50S ribosomal protein L29 [Candidatus Microgenomates bacterium]